MMGEKVTRGACGCCCAPHPHLPQLLAAPAAATAQTRSALSRGLPASPLHPDLIAHTEEQVQIPTKSQKKERLPNLQLFLERELGERLLRRQWEAIARSSANIAKRLLSERPES